MGIGYSSGLLESFTQLDPESLEENNFSYYPQLPESLNDSINYSNFDNAFTIYPNPIFDKLNIRCNRNSQEKKNISISNFQGIVVFCTETNDKDIIIDLTGKSSGFYFIKITYHNTVINSKVMKL